MSCTAISVTPVRTVFTRTRILQLLARPLLEKFWKLNDPNYLGFQDGDTIEHFQENKTGHEMEPQELLDTLRQYNLDPAERETKEIGDILMDFKDKPSDFDMKVPDPAGRFDAHFPHGHHSTLGHNDGRSSTWKIPELRAGDAIKIMAVKPSQHEDRLVKESLWAIVEAVVDQGIVVCTMSNDIQHPFLVQDPKYAVSCNDLVSIPVTRVLGVVHGKHWGPGTPKCAKCGVKDANKPLSKCSRCKRAAYCSREFQKRDWKHHKKTCSAEIMWTKG